MKVSKRHMINEGVLIDSLPEDIKQAVMQNRTSLGNNPAIPDIFDVPYLMKAVETQFESAKDELREIGSIDNVDGTTVENVLTKLILKCQKIETPYRNELEKICDNYIIDLLSVPEDAVTISMELVDEVDTSGESIIVDPIDGDTEFEDVNNAVSIRSEVFKRRFLDALCMGGALYLAENIDDTVLKEIEKFNPELPDLYKKIMSLNKYVLYLREDVGITDENKLQSGTVEVALGNPDEKVTIHSQGVIFPILLCETMRGFMELFISHGLPDDLETAKMVLGKSDFLKAEPWDMRIGPHIWNMFSKSSNDVTFADIPYLFKRISSLEVNKFNFLMKEMLAGTKKGRRIMGKICDNAKRDREYEKFVDKMDKMQTGHGIITDDYIHVDEL